jgi:hypothetical protein
MIKIQNKKSKPTQYVIGGTVAVIILGLWVSLPLMNGSSADSSVSAGNPFHSKVADISSLGSEVSSEGGAPGSPLSGEMINNPATSGEEMASSLFQSGPSEEPVPEASASASVDAVAPSAGGIPSSSAGAPAMAARGKLNATASIAGGNSNSMTAGGVHNKFFGTGNQKSEFAPALPGPDLKKMAAPDKKSALVAMLGGAADKSQLAAKTGNMDAAKGGASAAFANTAKANPLDMNSNLDAQSVASGLQMGQTAQDLKKSDPGMTKHKDADAEMKKQIMQMIIQAVIKVALGALL